MAELVLSFKAFPDGLQHFHAQIPGENRRSLLIFRRDSVRFPMRNMQRAVALLLRTSAAERMVGDERLELPTFTV